MKISEAKRDENGEWDFNMQMDEDEVSFLVELAVTSLIKVGVIAVKEIEQEQEFQVLPQQNAPSTSEVQ